MTWKIAVVILGLFALWGFAYALCCAANEIYDAEKEDDDEHA